MRSFETDRPDLTESPFTVDAGHFQYETDLFKTDRSTLQGVKTIQNVYNGFNFKAGITNTLDIQFILESFTTRKIIEGNSSASESGIGNITLRAKQNLWGDDNGRTAMAILPFIDIPTKTGSKVTGGVVFPLAVELSHDWDIGAELEFDLQDNQLNNGYHVNLLASSTVSHPLFSNLSFFAEGMVSRESELKSYEYFLDAGIVFEWKDNINLDTGLYYGLKSSSSKVFFIGLSFRI